MTSNIGEEIYKKSITIIDSLLKENPRFDGFYSEAEKAVVKRVIHATSDINYAEDIFFTNNSVQKGINLINGKIKKKEPLKIVCDDFDVYLSGTFGSHIKPEVIDTIDILPFKGKAINFIEDSVLLGCLKYATAKPSERENDLRDIIKIAKNFPLSGSKLFEKHFIKNIAFLP